MAESVVIQPPATGPDAPAPAAEPTPILGKFKDQAALEKAYTELEKKLGNKPAEVPTPGTPPPTPATPGKLDLGKYAQEFASAGKLSDESVKALNDSGIPKEFVESYIEGQKARQEVQTKPIFDAVGGKDKYTELLQWAGQNLSETDQQAFNSAVTKDAASALLAVQGLQTKFQSANGVEPSLVGGKGTNVSGDVFRSFYEVEQAMKDPRYKADPAYRKSVEEKVGRSEL
jgi:hypothetical protein